MEGERKAHAIMIAYPYQGHVNPFVNLALKLASKGITITFVHLEFVHHKLSKAQNRDPTGVDFFSEARKSGLDIRYTTISDPFPLEFDRDLRFEEYVEGMTQCFPALVDEFVGKIMKSYPSNMLVTDTVYVWSAAIAKKYKLVNVSFWTEPAVVFSLLFHLDLLREKGHFPCKDNIKEEIDYIPGVESLSTRDLMPFLTESEATGAVMQGLSMAFAQVKDADFILHNTVHELESATLSALSKYQSNYAIGPINFCQNLATDTVSKSFWSESDCFHWLESKAPGSVFYVSFGSLVKTSKQVIEEIAYGLLLSEVSFIWVVREGILGCVLPEGFEGEVKDRGLIIPWCNQITVLSNPAVGGFLTHCGWNSTIESMWCGVPMICYPIAYDQPTNRKLVVEDWKVGIDLCDGESVDRKEVAEKIKNFMGGSGLKSLKQEANQVKKTMRNAMEVGGSSERNFEHFFDAFKAKIYEIEKNVDGR